MKGARLLQAIGDRASLRDMFNTARLPRERTPGPPRPVAPALTRTTKDADGKPVREQIAPPLQARPVACAGCGLARGTLRRVGTAADGRSAVYAHKGCTPRQLGSASP